MAPTRGNTRLGDATATRLGNIEPRDELERLRIENVRLRAENRELRVTLDAHLARARSSALFGPVELSAGTCVGPRRRRD